MPERHTLKAEERLKREKDLETLFRQGKAFSVFPLKLIWLLTVPRPGEEGVLVKTAFTAPKKKFRKAVHRNRVKRLMRESWRLQKNRLYPCVPAGMQLHVFLIFTGAVLPLYPEVFAAAQKGIDRLRRAVLSLKAADSDSKEATV